MEGVTAKRNGGQRIYLWPSLDLVVVITGGSYNEQSPSDEIQIKLYFAGGDEIKPGSIFSVQL